MQFVFLDMKGNTMFIRDDAERAQWSQEELTIDLDFPYLSDKVITIGQRIFFVDPSTGEQQIFEVKQAKTLQPDSFQQVVAEHICVSELTDEHLDEQKATDISCSHVLSNVLDGTLWGIGKVESNPTSSADITRGSVWQAILTIKENWNVYIVPSVTLNADGSITRKLNIKSTSGTWNGIRLSIDKNMVDPSVTIDDSELYTALWGYGGTINTSSTTEKDKKCDFSEVVWEKTSDHPAKPEGQKYLEDKDATREYGRDGRARFGYYQNNAITDPETLLEKTWETLKTVSKPRISVEGTVEDLYRLGYADEPLQLHDIALVEILPAGFKEQIQIIRLTVDLLDPTATMVTIGSYIPNIIYIERDTEKSVTGGGGGKTNTGDDGWKEFRTTIESYQDGTGMKFQAVQNDINDTNEELAVQTARIDLTYSMIRQEVEDRRDADNVLNSTITQTASEIRAEVSSNNSTIYSTIEQTATQIRSEVASTASGLYSSVITQTDSKIKAEVSANNSEIYSTIELTANGIRTEVAETTSGLYTSVITQTSNMIKAEVSENNSTVYSTIEQTASQIRSEVANTSSGLYSTIEQTASSIRSEVANTSSGLYSTIEQTASSIRSEVANTSSGLYSTIEQTASQIRSEVATSNSGIYSAITQTASDIRFEVVQGDLSLKSMIDVQASRIDIVVSGSGTSASINIGVIVDSINGQTGSFVKINADTIELSGYTKMTQFNALSGTVNGILAAGTFGANKITSDTINATTLLAASTGFNFKGHTVGSYACITTGGATFYALGYT